MRNPVLLIPALILVLSLLFFLRKPALEEILQENRDALVMNLNLPASDAQVQALAKLMSSLSQAGLYAEGQSVTRPSSSVAAQLFGTLQEFESRPLHESFRLGVHYGLSLKTEFPYLLLNKASDLLTTLSLESSAPPKAAAQAAHVLLHFSILAEHQSPGVRGLIQGQALTKKAVMLMHEAYLREKIDAPSARFLSQDLTTRLQLATPLAAVLKDEALEAASLLLKAWEEYPFSMWRMSDGHSGLLESLQGFREGRLNEVKHPVLSAALPDLEKAEESRTEIFLLLELMQKELESMTEPKRLKTALPWVIRFDGAKPVFGYQMEGKEAVFIPRTVPEVALLAQTPR